MKKRYNLLHWTQQLDLYLVWSYTKIMSNWKPIGVALFYISFFSFVLYKISNV